MSALDDVIARVIVREGGYVNDPNDAGGPTKYGITLATLHAWRNTPVGASDVQALTVTEASAIYKARFFPPGIEAINNPIVLEEIFDYGVNSGVGAVVKSLQTILQREGLYTAAIDGDFGPKSQAAAAQVANMAALFYALKCERYELEMRYIGSVPSQAKYAIGWANRNDQIELKF